MDLRTLAGHLNIQRPDIISKASEYLRFLKTKSLASINQGPLAAPAICLELACQQIPGYKVPTKSEFSRWSCCQIKVYTTAFQAVQKLLNLTNYGARSASELCLTFGCSGLPPSRIQSILTEYKEKFLAGLDERSRHLADFSNPVFVAVAFFLAAREAKAKVDRTTLVQKMSIQSKSFNNTLRQFEELLHLGKYSVKKKNLEKKGDRDEKDGREHEDEANTSRNRMLISTVDRGANARKRRLANDNEDAATYAAGKTSSYLKEASDTDSEEEEEEDGESHESDYKDRKKREISCKKQRFTNKIVSKNEEILNVSHNTDASLTASDVGETKASNPRLSFGSEIHAIAEATNGHEKKKSATEDFNGDGKKEGKEEGREECDDEEDEEDEDEEDEDEEDEDEEDEDEEDEDEDDVEEMEIYKRAISCLSRSRNGISQSDEKSLKNKPIHAVNRSSTSKPERSGRMSGAPTKHPWMKI